MPDSASPPQRLPSHTPTCMGCGPHNPHGLQLVVYRDGDQVYGDVTFDERHIGAPGLTQRFAATGQPFPDSLGGRP